MYDIHTFQAITRQYVTVLPMPRSVIEAVENKALSEGMKPLHFHDIDEVQYLPVGLPAGVAGNQGNEAYLQNNHQSTEDGDFEEEEQYLPARSEQVEDDEPEDIGLPGSTETNNDSSGNHQATTQPTNNVETTDLVGPDPAIKLPRIGMRRSARIAALAAGLI